MSVISTKLLLGQTLNHATFDVYTPKTAETLILGKCYGYCFLYSVWKRCSLTQYSLRSFSGKKINPSARQIPFFHCKLISEHYVNLYSFERLMKRPFPGIFCFQSKQKSPITNQAKPTLWKECNRKC